MKLENPSKYLDFRQSMNFINNYRIRNTIASNSSHTTINRETVSYNNSFRNSLDISIARDLVQQISYTKKNQYSSYQKLKKTLSQLQSKLSKAKEQLCKKRNVLDDLDEDDNQNEELSIQMMVDSLMKSKNSKCVSAIQSLHICKGKISTESTKTFPSMSTSLEFIQKIKTYYIEQLAKGMCGKSKEAYEHLSISLKVIKSVSNFEPLSLMQIEERKVFLPRHKDDKRKTLVIDIDETIIHCEQQPSGAHDLVLAIKLQNEQYAKAWISIRPYAISFLRKMSRMFEIVAFTASHESYADVVLDEIDPKRELISHRLYRRHCFEIHPNIYTKDLRIINRDLSQMVLVDNAPYSYIFQLQNGIPILPFYKGQDYQLPKLEKYLEEILKCKDVRELNKQTFKLHQYGDFIAPEDLTNDLYFNKI